MMAENRVATSSFPKVPDTVLAAVKSNNSSVVSKWFSDLPIIDTIGIQILKQILLCSVKSLSVDVVKLFRPPKFPKELLCKLINGLNCHGMTIIHCAAEVFQPNKDNYTIMEVLAHLCEQGGDPTILCKQERTAKTIVEENGNRVATALLELLENIHNKRSRRNPAPEYSDINVVHKTILHWAVYTGRHEIVSHILVMHERDTYDNISHLLFEADTNSAQCFQEAPIFTAVRIGNSILLQGLLARSGVPLSTILGQRQKRVIPRPDGPDWEHFITPLSLILSMPQNHDLIDVLIHLNRLGSIRNLTAVDLSRTLLSQLPVELFTLGQLYTLNVSDNKLSELPFSKLPSDYWPNLLQELNVSHNNLQHIPSELFTLPCLKTLNVSHNPLKSLPSEWWTTKSIVTLNLSHTHLENLSINSKLSSAPKELLATSPPRSVICGQYSTLDMNAIPCKVNSKKESLLQYLNCSNCKIGVFPSLLAFFFPNLELLNISSNKLQSCCAVNEFPSSLIDLDVSNNLLLSGKHKMFYRDINKMDSCMRHGELSKLKFLKLAGNVNLKMLSIHDEQKYGSDGDARVFFPNLVRLNLTNCGLKVAPKFLAELKYLTDLDFSGNKDLTIPREISNLEHLVSFNYEGVKDPIVDSLNMFELTQEKLVFLHEDCTEGCPSIKLIFVGHDLINLPSCLTEKSIQDKSVSLFVANQHTWCISKPNSTLVSITFNVWNFIGQDGNTAVSQCFLSGNAMYVLCWKITNDKDHGIAKLKNWLLRIQNKAKHGSVVIVGCHNASIGGRLKRHLVEQVKSLYEIYFPNVSGEQVKFVSAATLKEDMIKLCRGIYDTASKLHLSLGSKFFKKMLKDVSIPVSYLTFQGIISNKVVRIEKGKDKGPPILTWDDILKMGEHQKHGKPLFREKREFSAAVNYMIESGVIMHFDFPGVSDCYFIDPHWLYGVFCQVCKSPMFHYSSRIDTDDGKVSRFLIQQIFDECNIPDKYFKPVLQLLHRFDVAIPLDTDTLLLPSTLSSNPHNKLYSSVNCKFPRDRVPSTPSLQKQLSFGNLLSIATCTLPSTKNITLRFTNMCYRRLFLSHHIPGNFWAKLISRFIASAKSFYDILLNNCVEGMTIERMANVGDAVICSHHCRWLYWSNGITLTFGDYVLLCVNGLMQANTGTKNEGHKIPLSVTVDKIKTMKFFNGKNWEQLFHEDTDGFEVNVPDYVVHSSVEENSKTHTSVKLGPQILSHILEILNELCTEIFRGFTEGGIYTYSYLSQLVICPLCYGDKPGDDYNTDDFDDEMESSLSDSLHHLFNQSIKPFDVVDDTSIPVNAPYGFTIQICILKAQKGGAVFCPSHGSVNLRYLTPDLMFEDVIMEKVCATQVGNKLQQLGQGGFSSVYKVKLISDSSKYVALKSFTNFFVNGKQKDLSLRDLAVMYCDIRLELNKLSTVSHPNIVQFLGLCIVSFSILLEWAPKGNLNDIISEYRLADMWICPDAVAKTVHQVSSALSYLHTEKNIVHFDIKPENILVFKYPQAGHFCFSKETSLNCESCYSEDGGVLVKLADLGISALVGPSGFQRSTTTPIYVAPEVLKYLGKEPLTEKVDIFSLGISLYEVVTLRKLPPEGSYFDFNADIIAGRRPEFLPEDPNYPLPLIECVRGCWAQDYTQRPTAKKIEDSFKSPNCLRLKNSYNIKSITVNAMLVTKMIRDDVEEELIWVACTSRDGYKLVSYTFAEQEDSLFHKIIKMKKTIRPKLCVAPLLFSLLSALYTLETTTEQFMLSTHIQ
ncbi:leucine-rich repeat serine/threonine-protein kinase 1-like isoform X2 [Dysidea avara]|uniref:leucine-rich repeat serine/threonine-protein kinase 1-like isoform X2 n=1 Tax=Dysidea avara TaxID=196820 RepID=UPI003330473F